MRIKRDLGRVLAGLGAAMAFALPAAASVVPFTWDPSQAIPALTSSPAKFSADTMSLTNYLRVTNANDFTTLRQNFSGTHIQTINGFTLGGAPVSVPGLNTAYGLYFQIALAGSFPINASGAVIGPSVTSLLNVQLIADVGRDDGSVVDNMAGIGFGNPTGVTNDVVLATGSLQSAALAVSSSGTRNANYFTTLQPTASESGFFAGPNLGVGLQELLNSPLSTFQITPLDAVTTLQVVGADGGSTGVAQLVTEPTSLALCGAGLLSLMMVRRRGRI